MKPSIAFLCTLFLFSSLQAQKIKPSALPDVVLTKFSLIYPDASRTAWTQETDHFQVEFKNDKKNTTAVFTSEGKLFLTRTEIRTSALPEPALEFLRKEDNEVRIEAAFIVQDHRGVITFNASIDDKPFVFDWTGQHMTSGAVAASIGE